MIVCHCNLIDDAMIREATSRLADEAPLRIVTPGSVYRALGKRPRCGGCLPLATSIIYAHLACPASKNRTCPLAALADAMANDTAATPAAGTAATARPRVMPFIDAAE